MPEPVSGREHRAAGVDLHFSAVQSGTTATKYLRNPRSYRRRYVRVDGRSRAYQAIKLKVHQYTRAIGAAAKDPLTKARIVELAELEVLTSELRAAGLRARGSTRSTCTNSVGSPTPSPDCANHSA